jgi:iron complex outermembrane receptor protein
MKKRLVTALGVVIATQSTLAAAAVLEEVVITAQKREQNLQDVGVSVSAFSGDQMKALGVTNTVDITQQVPGLQVNTWSPTLTTFNLRGVSQNNFTDNLEAPVAVYSDDVYIGSMNAISGQLFDVERVEVLRGPQGTLFGRNATGGLIHYVSRDASDDELNGYVEVGSSEFNTTTVEGAVGGAITDKVRGRVSARWEQGDGYVEATTPGVRDLGGRDGYALRGTLQVDFSDNLVGDFSIKYSEDTDVATGGYVVFSEGGDSVDPVTGLGVPDGTNVRPFEHDSEYEGSFDREATSFTGKLTYVTDNALEFTSITNYTDLDKFYTEDGDAFPILAVNFTTIAEYEQFSQEFRLSGESDSSRWQVGAYYLDMDVYSEAITEGIPGSIGACFAGLIPEPNFPGATCLDFAPGGIPDVPADIAIPLGAANTQIAEQQSTNWSLFGQYEYDFSEATTVILGFRWSQDDKEIDFVASYQDQVSVTDPVVLFNASQALDAAGLGDNDEIDYGDYAARIQVDHWLNEQTLMFASYNRGIKGGNWSVNADVTPDNFRHDEEVLNSFEVGFKSDFGIARLNGTVFYYDYEDYQAFSLTGLVPQVENTDATVQGGELELFLTPNVNWDFLAGLSIIDSEVDEVIDANGGIVTGNELPNAPGYSINLLGRYNFDTDVGNWAFQVDGVINDDQFLEVTNAAVSAEDGYSVWNTSVSLLTLDEALRVTGWVKNVTEEEYRIYNLDLGVLGATSFYAPPRWYGVSVNYTF